jgi:hypothetical protein
VSVTLTLAACICRILADIDLISIGRLVTPQRIPFRWQADFGRCGFVA